MSSAGPLEKDMEAFRKQLPQLQKDSGKFVVFVDGNLVAVVTTIQEAYKLGLDKAGAKPFLVKQITAIPTIQHFTRIVGFKKCPTSS